VANYNWDKPFWDENGCFDLVTFKLSILVLNNFHLLGKDLVERVSLVSDVAASNVEDEAKVNMVFVVNTDFVTFICLCDILDEGEFG